MHLGKIIVMAAAVTGIAYYLPALIEAHAQNPLGLAVTLVCIFYLGYISGEFVEFCTDRLHLFNRL